MSPVIGTDVSSNDAGVNPPAGIDFAKMRDLSEFTIIRAGQGLKMDQNFKLNWKNAKAAAIPRGSYWFFDSRVDPKAQVDAWVGAFNGDYGELPMFVDLEEKYKGKYSGWQNWKIFLDYLKLMVGGKEVGIYTSFIYFRELGPNPVTDAQNLEYFHQFPLWIVEDNTSAADPQLLAPWGADEWLFWKFSFTGDGPSLGTGTANTNLNFFNGSIDTFNWRFNRIVFASPPTETPEPTPTDELNTRAGIVDTFTVPMDGGSYYQVLHDYERDDMGHKPRSIAMNYKGSLPETVPLNNPMNGFFPLSEDWQRWWFDLLTLAANGAFTDEQLKGKWGSLTADSRAFTDNHASQNGYADYILRKNLGSKPIAIKRLTTGGNLVKAVDVSGKYLTIECLNVTLPPPSIKTVWLQRPWLYQWAGQETLIRLPDKNWRTDPFPQLSPYGSPVPVCSKTGLQTILKSYVKPVDNGRTYKIYNV